MHRLLILKIKIICWVFELIPNKFLKNKLVIFILQGIGDKIDETIFNFMDNRIKLKIYQNNLNRINYVKRKDANITSEYLYYLVSMYNKYYIDKINLIYLI